VKCDFCGCQFPMQEARHDTRTETLGKGGGPTKLVKLCPMCASTRVETRRFVFWIVVLLPVGAILVGVLGSLLISFLR